MDVRGAAVDGLDDDLIDEAHHRRVVGVALGEGFDLGAVSFSAEVEITDVIVHDRGVLLLQGVLKRLGQLALTDDHLLDVEPGLELEILQHALAGRVAHADKQAPAALMQRQRLMLAHQLFIDQLHDRLVDIQGVEIKQRQVEAARGDAGDIAVAGQFVINQIADQGRAFLARLLDGLQGNGFINQAIEHKLSGKPT